jgi:hypothetical protein
MGSGAEGRTFMEVGADGVALITFVNPPINSLSFDGTRSSLIPLIHIFYFFYYIYIYKTFLLLLWVFLVQPSTFACVLHADDFWWERDAGDRKRKKVKKIKEIHVWIGQLHASQMRFAFNMHNWMEGPFSKLISQF